MVALFVAEKSNDASPASPFVGTATLNNATPTDPLASVRLVGSSVVVHEPGAPLTPRATDPDVVVVVVSAHRDPTWVVRATQAGASAFAPKSGSLSEMLSVLCGARNGTMLVAPSLFTNTASSPESSKPSTKLTDREHAVLKLMGQGMSASPIARVLNISVHTCRGYVKTIHAKLDARSQLEEPSHRKGPWTNFCNLDSKAVV